MTTSRYMLTVIEQVPNPEFETAKQGLRYSSNHMLPPEFTEQRRLEIWLTPEEFHAVRMAVLSEMAPKKDAQFTRLPHTVT